MIGLLVRFFTLLSTIFTVLFFALLFAMHEGYDPRPLLGHVDPPSDLAKEGTAIVATTTRSEATTTRNENAASTTTPSVREQEKPRPAATSTPTKTSLVKRPAKPTPSVAAPAPLVSVKTQTSSSSATSSEPGVPSGEGALNQSAILAILNRERTKAGLPELGFNKRLSAIAEGKAVDMINKQYFAHVSPSGVDVATLAKNFGYQFIFLGENLALGDFRSSEEVMNGWMNSPGHRANILSKNFTEVGISALEGNYQGRIVWYAVQEFGRPMSSCPTPDEALEAKVRSEEAKALELERSIVALRAEIDRAAYDPGLYNSLVERYNPLVDEYTALSTAIKADIETFNAGVSAYNRCIGAAIASDHSAP